MTVVDRNSKSSPKSQECRWGGCWNNAGEGIGPEMRGGVDC